LQRAWASECCEPSVSLSWAARNLPVQLRSCGASDQPRVAPLCSRRYRCAPRPPRPARAGKVLQPPAAHRRVAPEPQALEAEEEAEVGRAAGFWGGRRPARVPPVHPRGGAHSPRCLLMQQAAAAAHPPLPATHPSPTCLAKDGPPPSAQEQWRPTALPPPEAPADAKLVASADLPVSVYTFYERFLSSETSSLQDYHKSTGQTAFRSTRCASNCVAGGAGWMRGSGAGDARAGSSARTRPDVIGAKRHAHLITQPRSLCCLALCAPQVAA
jgi:hypothetical protein